MKLSQLLSAISEYQLGNTHLSDVVNIVRDSRQVESGSLFVAVKGHTLDGHDYLEKAVDQGAIGLVVEEVERVPKGYQGAVVKVGNARLALNQLAAKFYGNPAQDMFCIGITGTNGKTTTAYLIETILHHFGWKTGVLGTIDHHIGEHKWESQLTTPDAIDLQRRLGEFKALGARASVFEVSSHALDQHRMDSIPLDVAVFTNLSRDHLDYHASLEEYFSCKELLFKNVLLNSQKKETWALVNTDDEWGKKLACSERATIWTYGESKAHITFQVFQEGFQGSHFLVRTPRGEAEVKLPLPGRHNIYNALAAIGVGLAAGGSLAMITEALSMFPGVPGRLEKATTEDSDPFVFVDYAHTPDALEKVLQTLKNVRDSSDSSAKIITVFGCGGDRDKGKRPEMGKIAESLSDFVVVTSDNPRGEDPETILDEIIVGIPEGSQNPRVFKEVHRKIAIARALQIANENDVILIAGKGHEDYQIIGDTRLDFSDIEVARELMAKDNEKKK